MSDPTPPTDHFGFTRVGHGESLSKAGHSALDLDRIVLDDLLWALANHTHTEKPALDPPDAAPMTTAYPDGGTLPANTLLYYRVSFLDEWGLETAASPESEVSTPASLSPPTAPSATVETAGGTLKPGRYAYALTHVTHAGGESSPGPRVDVRIDDGTENRVVLDLPDLPSGATEFRVYRTRPGQTQLYYLTSTTEIEIYDDGINEDTSVIAPRVNTTNSNCSVEVALPDEYVPEGVVGWRLYRSVVPGNYDGQNLVHEVVEMEGESGDQVRATWVDDGSVLEQGVPRERSATVGDGRIIELEQIAGKFPLQATPRGARNYDAYLHEVEDGRAFGRTRVPNDAKPTRITAFFQDAPPLGEGYQRVAIRAYDEGNHEVRLVCDDAYSVVEFSLNEYGRYEAEHGERSEDAHVPIRDDRNASNGQVVELYDADDWIQAELGELDAGLYHTRVRLRLWGEEDPSEGDLRVWVIDLDGNEVLAEIDLMLTRQDRENGTLETHDGPDFHAPGGRLIGLRVGKRHEIDTVYLIDWMEFEADLVELQAGDVTLEIDVVDPDLGESPSLEGRPPPYMRLGSEYYSNDSRLSYEGPWSEEFDEGAIGGSFRIADDPDCSVEVPFRGTRVEILGRVGPDHGIAEISLDGVLIGEADFYRENEAFAHRVFLLDGIEHGEHTLRIDWVNRRNENSSGWMIALDAVMTEESFIVVRPGDTFAVEVFTDELAEVNYLVSITHDDHPFLSVDAPQGLTSGGERTFTVDSSGLAPGTHWATVNADRDQETHDYHAAEMRVALVAPLEDLGGGLNASLWF